MQSARAMGKLLGTGIGVAWLLAGAPAVAEPLQPLVFDESLNPEVQVSGATRGGLLFDAMTRPDSLERMVVRLPDEAPGHLLCVSLITRDGRYQARMEFDLPQHSPGFVELAYPTQFRSHLLQDGQPYLAVLASLRSDCSKSAGSFVPVAWEMPDSPDQLFVIINAGHHDARISVPDSTGDRKLFPCQPVDSEARIAFDQVCTIDLAPGLDLRKTKIERDDFFNPLPAVDLPIALRRQQ